MCKLCEKEEDNLLTFCEWRGDKRCTISKSDRARQDLATFPNIWQSWHNESLSGGSADQVRVAIPLELPQRGDLAPQVVEIPLPRGHR